jgi:transcription elongation factor Elf1
MKEKIIECPVCGEIFSVDEDDEITVCTACGAWLWLEIDEAGNVTHIRGE